MMEENLRRALLLSRGDWSTFVTRPLSAGLLIAAALMIVVVMLPSIQQEARSRVQGRVRPNVRRSVRGPIPLRLGDSAQHGSKLV